MLFFHVKTMHFNLLKETAESFETKYGCYLKEFQKNNTEFSEYLDPDSNVPHDYITFTYDGLWTLALALDSAEKELKMMNSGLTLSNLTYFGETNVTEVVAKHIMSTSFIGVSVSLHLCMAILQYCGMPGGAYIF